jgi:predicted type IV restriction endonuclease
VLINIRKPLKRFLPHFIEAQEQNLNEADTVMRLVRSFEEVFGYDPMSDITRETQVKHKFVDVALKTDGAIRLLVEAKAAGVVLRDRHIEQAERYAAEGNYPWVLLTNGVVWNLYHLTFDEGIEYEKAFTVDLTTTPIDAAADTLAVLHKKSIQKGELDAYWRQRSALSAQSLGAALFAEPVVKLIRREIRRTEGLLVDEEDLAKAIHAILSQETRELIGPVRIRRRRRVSRPTKKPEPATSDGQAANVPPCDQVVPPTAPPTASRKP